MKIAIVGKRKVEFSKRRFIRLMDNALRLFLDRYENEIEILTGCAGGVDKYARFYAKLKGYPLKVYDADWDKYGLAAGPIRNDEMLREADGVIAVWDGKSKGTADSVERAHRRGIPLVIISMKLAGLA